MKTEMKENDKPNRQPEGLADLPVADEQAEHAKGGPTLNYTKFEITYIEQGHKP